jgi:hypothetical protein
MDDYIRILLGAILISSAGAASAQEFECVRQANGGVDLFGKNQHDRVLRCEVTCKYWKPDGSESYERCKTQLTPNQPRQKMCSWNLNDAKTIIGASHECQ